MNDRFDAFVANLQEQIFDETRKAYGEAGFQRWRNPLFRGPMKDADSHARVKGQCGDTMEIFLKVENGRVRDAAYLTDGCGSSTICGSFAAEWTLGKQLEALADFTGDDILKKLERFPEEDRHCAFLAAAAVQEALRLYWLQQGEKR